MPRISSSTRLFLAILGVSLYLIYFFSLELPNSPPSDAWGKRTSRWMLWAITIPGVVPDEGTPIGYALRQLSQFGNLLQRLPILGCALFILFAAIGAGDVPLRILRFRSFRNADDLPSHAWNKLEQLVFAFGLGMTVLSVGMLGFGLLGWMSRWLICAVLMLAAAWTVQVLVQFFRAVRVALRAAPDRGPGENRLWSQAKSHPAFVAGSFAAGLFLLLSLLGAMLPATDFDVLTYHLQGPKEYYLAGTITFAEHNVYMNMPFGTEMLSLIGMIVAGDWWWGGLVGQVVLSAYSPLAALAILLLGRRCFGTRAGCCGALIYLSTPWVYRISVIPLTENALAFYLVTATLSACRAAQSLAVDEQRRSWLLAGLSAGSAAACKYTALTSTVFPIALGAVAVALLQRPRGARTPIAGVLSNPATVVLGVALAFAPWLARNAIWTSNPTYPLLYGLFDGYNWTAEKNEKWEWGHRVALLVTLKIQRPPAGVAVDADDFQHSLSFAQLFSSLHNVSVQSDWLSPLLFSLAPLALIGERGRRSARWLWVLVGFLFLQWWLLTHRNDRFWVPMLPLVAVLAGGGCVWSPQTIWRRFLTLIVVLTVWLNLSYTATSLCGYNQFGIKLIPHRHPFEAGENWLANHLPPSARLLAVGESAFFHLDRDVYYNTVFDDCLFVVWLQNRSPEEAAEELRRRQITHVFVNWSAIQVYRSPGGYGFSSEVVPKKFSELVSQGVLRRLPFDVADAAEPVLLDNEKVPPRELYQVLSTGQARE